MASASSSDTALKTTNDIKDIPPQDEIYQFYVEANKRPNPEQSWANEWALVPLRVGACIRLDSDDTVQSPTSSSRIISAVAPIKMARYKLSSTMDARMLIGRRWHRSYMHAPVYHGKSWGSCRGRSLDTP